MQHAVSNSNLAVLFGAAEYRVRILHGSSSQKGTVTPGGTEDNCITSREKIFHRIEQDD